MFEGTAYMSASPIHLFFLRSFFAPALITCCQLSSPPSHYSPFSPPSPFHSTTIYCLPLKSISNRRDCMARRGLEGACFLCACPRAQCYSLREKRLITHRGPVSDIYFCMKTVCPRVSPEATREPQGTCISGTTGQFVSIGVGNKSHQTLAAKLMHDAWFKWAREHSGAQAPSGQTAHSSHEARCKAQSMRKKARYFR